MHARVAQSVYEPIAKPWHGAAMHAVDVITLARIKKRTAATGPVLRARFRHSQILVSTALHTLGRHRATPHTPPVPPAPAER